jgi:uncharacterized protein YndB with AHSA1/START domain
MSTPKRTIKLEQLVEAPVSHVYRAFTNSTAMREWLSDLATLEARPGGRFYLWWNSGYYTAGEYTRLVTNKEVSFTWNGRGEPRPTQVTVTFKPKRKNTLIRLVHRGLGRGPVWENKARVFEEEWRSHLQNLASVLGHGPDLRITQRPMLGISLSDFNAEIAKKLGVPVTAGIRLDGVIDGMGAKAAGLQHDDVLVEFAGQPLQDFTDLTKAISGKKAGDQIPVSFYRGSELKSVTLTLSGRPIPEIPPIPESLSNEVAKAYLETERQMDEFVKDITEREAEFIPGKDEWSIKEVLAHLIHSERGWQNVISEIISGDEASYDGFGGNLNARVLATVEVFPTLNDLVTEWKRLNRETIALLRFIPSDFTERKGSYWRLAYQCLNFPSHFSTHLEQMQAALQAARK